MAWFHVILSLRDAPSSSVPLKVLPFRPRVAAGTDTRHAFFSPCRLKPRPRAFFFQDHDSDLLRVQPAHPKSSGRADMAGWQWLGRSHARASGGVHSEATTGYARTRFDDPSKPAFFFFFCTLWKFDGLRSRDAKAHS